MCGIGGVLFSSEKKEALQNQMSLMNALQKHRGPDKQASVCFERHALCHQRLILMDAAGGQQPLWDATKRYVIVYNGELYNYQHLKKSLAQDYPFTTLSDTEVVLASYLKWGDTCVEHFNGMFSFLIWDTLTESAFAARDPLGVKPFVYHYRDSTFSFASEVKTILGSVNFKHSHKIDPYGLAEYLIAPYFSGVGTQSIFKNIQHLEPGTSMRITQQGIQFRKYYQFNPNKSQSTEYQLIKSIAKETEESVRLSLQADVPLGLFLSGGLDSSLIAAIAKQYDQNPLTAFSVAFTNHSEIEFSPTTIVNSDDLPYAKELANQLSFRFQQVDVNHEYLNENLKTLVGINERIPAWEQEFSQHFLSREASKHFKAVLVGDAADETHYGYFFLLNEAINGSPLKLMNFFGAEKRVSLLAPHLQRQLQPLNFLDSKYREIAKQSGFDFDKGGEESILAMSTLVRSRWLERLLHNGDIHTMHYGLEARVPFANRNLLDVACNVYPCQGFKQNVEKYILRQAASKWLSPKFYRRKKSALPRDPRLGKAYQNILRDLLLNKNDCIEAYLHRSALQELCALGQVNETDRMILFNVICLILWSNMYAK